MRLGEIGTFRRGKGIAKKDLKDKGDPAIHYGQIYTDFGHSITETISYVDEDLVNNPVTANYGDLLITISDVSSSRVGKATTWLGDQNPILGGDIISFTHEYDPCYMGHYFDSHYFKDQRDRIATSGMISHLSSDTLKTVKIPHPPLEVQQEIGATLGGLSTYIEGLEKDLELRKKQYTYALDRLFDFSRFD